MIRVALPTPPSTNALFFNRRRGRSRTKEYNLWIVHATNWLMKQKPLDPVTTPGRLLIEVPHKTLGDISNRIKAVEDLLVSQSLSMDDRYTIEIVVRRSEDVPMGQVNVTMRGIDEEIDETQASLPCLALHAPPQGSTRRRAGGRNGGRKPPLPGRHGV